jgi:hypoxanthine phosphoribosyltransferase
MSVFAAPAGLGEVLFTAEQLQHRVRQLGEQISADYHRGDLLLVGALNGGAIFTADLARALLTPAAMDWMGVSCQLLGSGGSGTLRLFKDLDTDPAGRDVLMVGGIMDTGLSWLAGRVARRRPRSLACCVLLRRSPGSRYGTDPRYIGFDVDGGGLGGYGLGHGELYRTLPEIRRLCVTASGRV